ncbi:MAG: NADH-quinone oxidoreductase subunit M [Phycisphaeraceae bacterium]|nr:NADH-quinone oxidoreductase subunit M [Phycisphaeraceae bacterium]
MNLVMLIAIPLAVALAMPLIPARSAKTFATAATLAALAWFLVVAAQFPWAAGSSDHMEWIQPWFPGIGLSLSLAADTVSMLLVGLTVLLGPIVVVCSYSAITERVRTYYGWFLALQACMTGVFFSRDLILFYIFFEFTLIPMYVLINLYGGNDRRHAATKFFLFTFTGSLITLAGFVFLAVKSAAGMPLGAENGGWSFQFSDLSATANALPLSVQSWVFLAIMIGFAVKVPLFPVHTWLPLTHTQAPTAGSVILAGVLLKLGTYGIYRFGLGFTPDAAIHFAPAIGVLSLIGILYAGLICWVQTDAKKLVAYSSVSHLGFCILGMFSMTAIGLTGSVLYMINHGLSTGALFLLIGMVYERYHTHSMKHMSGLAAKMPVWATFMVFFAMASVGLPGLNGFVGELFCLIGTFQGWSGWPSHGALSAAVPGELGPWFAFFAALGMIVTAMYLLFLVGRIVWGKLELPTGHGDDGHGHGNHSEAHAEGHSTLPVDLNAREIGVLVPLAVACIAIGFYPKPLVDVLDGPSRQLAGFLEHRRQAMAANAGRVAGPEAEPATNAGHDADDSHGPADGGHEHTEGAPR